VLSNKHVRNLESARISVRPQLRLDEEGKYCWRTDLQKSESHWYEWFNDLSKVFLSVRVPKLLVLADDESLDRELTIGQMQGKYQALVVPNCGHSIQEDDPRRFSSALLHFLRCEHVRVRSRVWT